MSNYIFYPYKIKCIPFIEIHFKRGGYLWVFRIPCGSIFHVIVRMYYIDIAHEKKQKCMVIQLMDTSYDLSPFWKPNRPMKFPHFPGFSGTKQNYFKVLSLNHIRTWAHIAAHVKVTHPHSPNPKQFQQSKIVDTQGGRFDLVNWLASPLAAPHWRLVFGRFSSSLSDDPLHPSGICSRPRSRQGSC